MEPGNAALVKGLAAAKEGAERARIQAREEARREREEIEAREAAIKEAARKAEEEQTAD